MANDIYEHKCPCCGGSLSFNSDSQKIKCPYCDTEFEVDALKADEQSWQEEQIKFEEGGKEWTEEEQQSLSVFTCNSCGGELVGEETTASSFCPYCGSPVIFKGRLSGGLKPDFVIPFQISKEQVNTSFASFIKKKALLPKAFKTENKTEEIKGLYVPFWVYDADVFGRVVYRATQTRTWADSNYTYHETKYYSVVRSGNMGFDHIPVDGSKKMPDDLMESIEPYDFSSAVAFNSGYLSGFYSDKYDVEQKETEPRATQRIKKGVDDTFRTTIHHYSSLTVQNENVSIERSKVNYTLYPVWMVQKSWKDKKYTYAINGQTGKMAGELPISYAKLSLFVLLALVIGALIGVAAGYLLELVEEEWFICLAITGILPPVLTGVLLTKQMKTVSFQNGASDYYRKNSMVLQENSDRFLYRNVTRTRRASSSNSSNRKR